MRAIASLSRPTGCAALLATVGAAEHGRGVVFVACVALGRVDLNFDEICMSANGSVGVRHDGPSFNGRKWLNEEILQKDSKIHERQLI